MGESLMIMPLRAISLLCIGLGLAISSANSAQAEYVQCRRGTSPDDPKQTTTKLTGNLPLEQPITFKYKNDFYYLELGYLWGWGTPKSYEDPKGLNLEGVNQFTNFIYSFWMPDLRYPEVNGISQPGYRPCENGRPIPQDDAAKYIVIAELADLTFNAQNEPITPSYQYKRRFLSTTPPSTPSMILKERKYGLVKVTNTKWPNPFDDVYIHRKGALPETFIECVKPDLGIPQVCHAQFYYPDTNLFLDLHYPRDAQPHWREILAATLKLRGQWQIKDPKELKRLKALQARERD